MPYRRTKKMESRLAERRAQILVAARSLVAEAGYRAVSVPAVAKRAGVSTGLIYNYFDSKAVLFDEVFRSATEQEIEACEAAARQPGSARERIGYVIETFAYRALAARQLAWALLAEPVETEIEQDRLRFRAPYRRIFAALIREGIDNGEIIDQDEDVVAAAMVGGVVEALIGPLSAPPEVGDADRLIHTIISYCTNALGPMPEPNARQHTLGMGSDHD
ncbi:TetR/AcrR family transcriptional regulator [Salinisphaera sp. LB1]|uniref:TetR/AcrR family transcriptional regulator n=1 Tax=Salinisphaera sp. LB1 TaxID=2183911 RepID=UPI000D7059C4|nr:TetR/AcrR family transcriptional regulator [Salinisphaera sp. LB1]